MGDCQAHKVLKSERGEQMRPPNHTTGKNNVFAIDQNLFPTSGRAADHSLELADRIYSTCTRRRAPRRAKEQDLRYVPSSAGLIMVRIQCGEACPTCGLWELRHKKIGLGTLANISEHGSSN